MSSFKDFIKEKNISLRTLSFETGIPYSTLSDLANERTDIEQMRFGYVMKIASFFSMSPEALYDICKPKIPQPDDGELFIKNKKYYLKYKTGDGEREIPLHSVTGDIKPFIKELATWTMDDIRQKEQLEKWQIPTTL